MIRQLTLRWFCVNLPRMIKENLQLCRQRIAQAAEKIGIAPQGVTLVAVSKGLGVPIICEAIDAGIDQIAESRVQEALLKYSPVQAYAAEVGRALRWHMVGYLQTNKVRQAVQIFDLIHSVDMVRLATVIDKEAKALNKIQEVLLEVNVSSEASKFGFPPQKVFEALKEMSGLKHVRVKGLMTIAPQADNPEKTRPYFQKLKELRDSIVCSLSAVSCSLDILSMGMTEDFPVAIEEGSTMVRIGRGIFGQRLK